MLERGANCLLLEAGGCTWVYASFDQFAPTFGAPSFSTRSTCQRVGVEGFEFRGLGLVSGIWGFVLEVWFFGCGA
jgi:hypothetical protein